MAKETKEPSFMKQLGSKLFYKFLAMAIVAGIVAGAGYVGDWVASLDDDDSTYDPETSYSQPTAQVRSFDIGFSVTMIPELLEQESENNDFFALGEDKLFAVNCNKFLISEYANYEDLKAFAGGMAEANNTILQTASDGSFFYIFTNDVQNYRFYTTVKQGAEHYYTVSFYCDASNWITYKSEFQQWAQSVTVQ